MNELDRKLYELLGDKTLSFGCYVSYDGAWQKFGRIDEKFLNGCGDDSVTECWEGEYNTSKIYEIIGHEPTIADLHRMFASLNVVFQQSNSVISVGTIAPTTIGYDCTRSLLSQSEETKSLIVNLIESYDSLRS